MNMRMPLLDGFKATKQIKAQLQGQATVIIALTASVLEEDQSSVVSVMISWESLSKHQYFLKRWLNILGVRYVYGQATPTLS